MKTRSSRPAAVVAVFGSLPARDPGPGSTLDSPGGQHAVLAWVSYTNASMSEPNAGTQPIPGTFSRVFFNV